MNSSNQLQKAMQLSSRAGAYDILFEPVAIGPVTARNRFYQVPHACGMGHLKPRAHAAMRAVKAQGGWAVVSTEETEIHPSSDLSPFAEQRIWDDNDIPALRLMVDAVHAQGALAAIELVHNGYHAANHYSRLPPLAPGEMSLSTNYPRQARAMDKQDIIELRRWHKQAAKRAKKAGFDIVYVYAGHGMTLAQQFLLPRFNQRIDEYGGSLENRLRLTRELLEETKDAIGDKCAIAFRFAVDELMGEDGMQALDEGHEVVNLLAELPDLWDVNVSGWENDSLTSRFGLEEGYQVAYTKFVKSVTRKPVVSVGCFSSPDKMVALVKGNVTDFIGAARPSIADPYLPTKIRDDRVDEIRECIGCNVCVSSETLGIPIRCTQNPTMGEEWRREWHPEIIKPSVSDFSTLVVGAGPAGLECALQLGRRGYHVMLAESSNELGGRALRESTLHGLSAWRRVCDNRIYELNKSANVDIYRASHLTANDIVDTDASAVFLATGAKWRRDGVGRSNRRAIPGLENFVVLTPDDIMNGTIPDNLPIVIFDDEQGYIGGVIAEQLGEAYTDVTVITSASVISPFTVQTLEQARVQRSLIEKGVKIRTSEIVVCTQDGVVQTKCLFSGRRQQIACETLVLVTQRMSENKLLASVKKANSSSGGQHIAHVEAIGDALAPGLIADAVYSGHLAARNFEADTDEIKQALFRREMPAISAD